MRDDLHDRIAETWGYLSALLEEGERMKSLPYYQSGYPWPERVAYWSEITSWTDEYYIAYCEAIRNLRRSWAEPAHVIPPDCEYVDVYPRPAQTLSDCI